MRRRRANGSRRNAAWHSRLKNGSGFTAFSHLLDEAVARGDLPPHDTHAAGLALLAYVQGLTVLVKTGNDPGLIRTIGPTIVAIAGAPATVAV